MHWRLVRPVVALASTLSFSAAGQGEPSAPDAGAPSSPTEAPKEATPEPGHTGESEAAGEAPAEAPGSAGADETAAPQAPGDAPAASGEPALGPPPGAQEAPHEDYEEPEVPMTPPAPDTLGGHFLLGAGASYLYPTGRLGSSLSHKGQVGDGLGIIADLGLGVSRQVVVGAWGQLGLLSEGSSCRDCKGTSLGVGPFVRYHLVQGLRFDPWLSFGIGYRKLDVEDSTSASTSYTGIEWARIQVGGEWYPAAVFGFGPYLGFSSGGYTNRPPAAGGLKAYYEFSAGLRLSLDVPGKRR